MASGEDSAVQAGEARAVFATTHWSVVLTAGNQTDPGWAPALETLCRTYWRPLYAYLRRRGCSSEDAQDLTQELFAGLLARNGLNRVTPLKGKFRSFLLASLHHLLADEYDRATRQKRGGGQPILSLDAAEAERWFRVETPDQMSPEKLYDRQWAQALVEATLSQLQQEYQHAGKAQLFAVLKHSLTTAETPRHKVAAHELHMSDGALRVAVHRLRLRFGELFRQRVAETVSGPDELEAEMRHLLEVLSD